ncbi:MAG: bifunctional glutamate N-acetyltransferase/amino-acid acetyltransferase ArgJ [Chloroflexi bacterium]|nr:bifunctional glutamate N-acetyltransferase/amino-acid acetyltransferase ArgJ [Chloroflexota bacterium]
MIELEPLSQGSITTPRGFRAAAVACGLKKNGALDLALVAADVPCAAAALFTTNRVQAAPILYDKRLLAHHASDLKGVVINSGCANACTGERGLKDAEATAQAVASRLGGEAGNYMVMSTGVIGQHLPMDKILRGIEMAAPNLSAREAAGHEAARAIMTTDTRPKEAAVCARWGSGSCLIAGMAKGSGMIHPNLATMLCLITTDARITPALAQHVLRQAAEVSLNRVTVDGDTSTNDTALLMASGLTDMPLIASPEGEAYEAFSQGLKAVLTTLAKEIARDGEGASHFIEIVVRGAANEAEAKQVAKAIAHSPLVKTAIYGQDANWGRIVCAAGYSGVPVDPDRMRVWLGDLELFREGRPYDINEARAKEILAQPEVRITVDLQMGESEVTVWTCDLTHRYIDINAHYRT